MGVRRSWVVVPGSWGRFTVEMDIYSLDTYREGCVFIHLANGSLKPLCGKNVKTEPVDVDIRDVEICEECYKRSSGIDYIMVAELVTEETE